MDKITIITPPDDVQYDGFRILLVDPSPEQTQIISDSLLQLKDIPQIIVYMWKSSELVEWCLQKKQKSDLIIFNANSSNRMLVGYFAANINTHYIGTLSDLCTVNTREIHDQSQCLELLNKHIQTYKDSFN